MNKHFKQKDIKNKQNQQLTGAVNSMHHYSTQIQPEI